ncbi:hypothetical protein [Variovorax boronicumulans]|uniref:hypothetical protein n=1 Tax=Variovorax boronicumulans TaxID=436515 RepID=UPI003391C7D7
MIDEQAAIALARAAAAAAGWAFVDPVQTRLRKPWFGKGAGRWEIQSNAMAFGARARFVIDAADGRILDKGYIPR